MLKAALPVLFVLLPMLAACSAADKAADVAKSANAAAPASGPVAESPTASNSQKASNAPAAATEIPAASARKAAYACDGGQRVDVANDVAVVHLADGRVIELRRNANDSSQFRNEALEFTATGDGADLAQDEGPTARCKAA